MECGSRSDFSFASDGFKIAEDRGEKGADFSSVINVSLRYVRATCPTYHVIPDFLIEWYLLGVRNDKAPHYVVFSTPLLPHPS